MERERPRIAASIMWFTPIQIFEAMMASQNRFPSMGHRATKQFLSTEVDRQIGKSCGPVGCDVCRRLPFITLAIRNNISLCGCTQSSTLY